MTIFDWASEHWFTAFCAIYFAAQLIELAIKIPFRCINIWKNGWPPEHCDADGEAVETTQQPKDTE